MEKETVEVPVEPISTSKRGWFNIALACIGASASMPEFKDLVSGYPKVAGAFTVIAAVTNYILLWKSKQGAVSKNVVTK